MSEAHSVCLHTARLRHIIAVSHCDAQVRTLNNRRRQVLTECVTNKLCR